MSYIVSGIDPAQFSHLVGLSDQELAAVGVVRKHIAEGVAIPERSELRDAPVGSDVLLVNFTYQPAANPYHGRHAIFVREGSTERAVVRDQVPEMLSTRLLSLRAFDHADMLVSAEVVPGNEVEPLIASYLGRPDVAYLHAHFAAPGCFAATITRG